MDYLLKAQLLSMVVLGGPHWYRLVKEIYQDSKNFLQNRPPSSSPVAVVEVKRLVVGQCLTDLRYP